MDIIQGRIINSCAKLSMSIQISLRMIEDMASFSECGLESLKINAIMNAKIEDKKLEFFDATNFVYFSMVW